MKANLQNKQDRVLGPLCYLCPACRRRFVFQTECINIGQKKNQVLIVCLFVLFFTLHTFLFLLFVVRISVCCFLALTDPDPDYRNPGSLLVRPLNSLVCFGGFPVLFKLQIALSTLSRTSNFHFLFLTAIVLLAAVSRLICS